MSDLKSDPKDDLDAILEGAVPEEFQLYGMIRKSDNEDTFELAMGDCSNWIEIPKSMVASIRALDRRIPCGDHSHPFAELMLKAPTSDDIWFSLLRRTFELGARRMAQTTAAPSNFWPRSQTGAAPSNFWPRRMPAQGPDPSWFNYQGNWLFNYPARTSCFKCWIATEFGTWPTPEEAEENCCVSGACC